MAQTACPCNEGGFNRIGVSFGATDVPMVPPSQPVPLLIPYATDPVHFATTATTIVPLQAGTYYITYTLGLNDPAMNQETVEIRINNTPVATRTLSGQAIASDSAVVVLRAGRSISVVVSSIVPFVLGTASITVIKLN